MSVLADASCACARAEALEGCIERVAILKRKLQRPKTVDLNLNPTEAIDDEDDEIDETDRDLSTNSYYFSLCGMVDGTTEVLHIDENDEWSTEPIVVEVKNRYRLLKATLVVVLTKSLGCIGSETPCPCTTAFRWQCT